MSADRHFQGWASAGLAGLAAALVVAGLVTWGGPAQGRLERRDAARLTDLNRLALHVECLARTGDGWTMPQSLDPTAACPGPLPGPDPSTGAPYRFQPLGASQYRLCANFERPVDPRAPDWTGGRNADCIDRTLPQATGPDAAP